MGNYQYAKKFLEESSWEKGKEIERTIKPPLELPFDNTGKIIHLPEPDLLKEHYVNFLEMVELRSTIRKYSSEPITLNDLSYLLWCTQGVKAANQDITLRTVPSAGAAHSIETYILVNNVENLENGVYRFLAIEHALAAVPADIKKVADCFSTYGVVKNSAVTFIWSTVIQRLAYRFGARAYRYGFIGAGHICQNLYLSAQTLGIGVCPLGAFDDNKINTALGFNEEEQFVVYGAAAGKR